MLDRAAWASAQRLEAWATSQADERLRREAEEQAKRAAREAREGMAAREVARARVESENRAADANGDLLRRARRAWAVLDTQARVELQGRHGPAGRQRVREVSRRRL